MEDVLVSGVTLDQNQSKITMAGVEDRPGLAAKIFGPIADAGIIVDMIIQNASADGRTDMTFTDRARGSDARARDGRSHGRRNRRGGRAARGSGRQGLDGRRRHAHACGRRGHDVQGAGGGAN